MLSHSLITVFMCGDVMTGRGIDQVLPQPCSPQIFEPYVRDARRYVELAEETNGLIPQPVDFSYIWGDAIDIILNREGKRFGTFVEPDEDHSLILGWK